MQPCEGQLPGAVAAVDVAAGTADDVSDETGDDDDDEALKREMAQ